MEITPQAALNVLSGSNEINSGTPSPFVAKIQASAVGKGMAPLDAAYVSINGASLCNTCGFRGDVSQEFIGDGAFSRGTREAWTITSGFKLVLSAEPCSTLHTQHHHSCRRLHPFGGHCCLRPGARQGGGPRRRWVHITSLVFVLTGVHVLI